jgi:membrane fusion protein, multidrug efflux system
MKKFLVLFLAFTVFACKDEKEKKDEVDYQDIRKDLSPTEVETGLVQLKDFEYRVNTSGKIEASREVIIPFMTNGLISNLSVRNGQRVSAGVVMVQLENEKEKLNLEKAEIQLENSRVSYKSEALSRTRGEISEEIKRTLELSTGIVANEINLREAQMNFDNTFVKAPISGVVANMDIKEGGMANSGKEFCRIYDPNSLVLKAKVLESDVAMLKTGQDVEIYPVSRNAGVFAGKLSEINPMVDENGLITVRITIVQGSSLLPGMNANAIIRIPQNKNLVVPKSAVVFRGGRQVVFTLEGGKAKWNYVETGMDNGLEIEILEGLEAGKTVITTNNLQLANDAPVQVARILPADR